MTRSVISPSAPDPWRASRWILAAVVVFDLLSFFVFIPAAERRALAASVEIPTWVSLVATLPGRAALVAVGLAGVVAFATRRASIAGGALALLALGLLSHAHTALNGAPWRHLFYSGLCLLGWLAGLVFARRRGHADDQRHAVAGMTALLGAAYFNAGLSKLVFGGVDWLAGETLRHAVVAQDGLVGAGPLHALRMLVVDRPSIAAALATATVAFELGGLLFLVGPRVRAAFAAGLVLMHLSILVLTGIAYVESMVLLLLFVLPLVPSTDDSALTAPAPRGTLIAAFGLGLVAAAAIARQGLDLADAARPDALVPAPTRALGPFTVGDDLAGFRIVELAAGGDAATIFLARDTNRIGLDLTCRDTPDVGPFDRPPLHVFYRPTELPLARLAPVGEAVRDLALTAAGPDVCAALTHWIATSR